MSRIILLLVLLLFVGCQHGNNDVPEHPLGGTWTKEEIEWIKKNKDKDLVGSGPKADDSELKKLVDQITYEPLFGTESLP